MSDFNKRIVFKGEITPGNKICPRCNRNFLSIGRQKYCGKCYAEVQCNICKNWYRTTREYNFSRTCKSCAVKQNAKNNTKPGKCAKCGNFSEIRNISGLCEICKKDYYIKHNNKINKSRLGFGKCVKCGNENIRNAAGLCKQCQPNFGKGLCNHCGKIAENRNAMGLCQNCYNIVLNKIRQENSSEGYCIICGNFGKRNVFCMCINCQNNHNKNNFNDLKDFSFDNIDCNINCKNYNICKNKNILKNKFGWCKNSPNILISFDREKFYSETYNVTIYESAEQMIEDFDSLLDVPGVWAVKSNNIVLDVCETNDIGKEMYQTVRHLAFMKGKTDEELCNMNNSYNRRKVRDIANEGKLDFVLIARDIEDKEERQKIEAQYAYDNKAKYWSPAPGQIIKDF